MEAALSARSLEELRDKATVLAAEVAAARKELVASTEQHRQALEAERSRGAALSRELAAAQRENEKQAALLKASGEAAKEKQTETAQNARSLEEARKKVDALALEAAAARKELAASTEKQRQAVEEERGRRAAIWSELATAQRENRDAGCSVAPGWQGCRAVQEDGGKRNGGTPTISAPRARQDRCNGPRSRHLSPYGRCARQASTVDGKPGRPGGTSDGSGRNGAAGGV